MISCNHHDYIEIVCMYQYLIKLTLISGETIQGKALDTLRNEYRDECLKIDCNGIERLVVLDEIKVLEACDDNPHLQKITF